MAMKKVNKSSRRSAKLRIKQQGKMSQSARGQNMTKTRTSKILVTRKMNCKTPARKAIHMFLYHLHLAHYKIVTLIHNRFYIKILI